MRLTRSDSHARDADSAKEPARRDQAQEAEEVEHEVTQLASGRPRASDLDDGATEGDTILPDQDADGAPHTTTQVAESERPPAESTEEPSDAPDGPQAASRPLGELLVGRGLVSADQLREALTKQT